MNRRPFRSLLVLALLGLAGCAGGDDDLTLEPAPPPLPPLPEAATAPDLERIGALPPQKLPPPAAAACSCGPAPIRRGW